MLVRIELRRRVRVTLPFVPAEAGAQRWTPRLRGGEWSFVATPIHRSFRASGNPVNTASHQCALGPRFRGDERVTFVVFTPPVSASSLRAFDLSTADNLEGAEELVLHSGRLAAQFGGRLDDQYIAGGLVAQHP